MSPYLIMFHVPKSVHFSVLQHLLHNNLLAVYYINALGKSLCSSSICANHLSVYRVDGSIVKVLCLDTIDDVGIAKTYETEACERHPLMQNVSNTLYTDGNRCIVLMHVEYEEAVVPSTVEQLTNIANMLHLYALIVGEELEGSHVRRSARGYCEQILTARQCYLLRY